VFVQQKVEPWKLYMMVGAFLVFDIILMITWQSVDPLARIIEDFPLEDPSSTDDDIKIKPELEHCESKHNAVWLGKFCDFISRFISNTKLVLQAFCVVIKDWC
jgi:gamma-aminobutyric acid type B receptor